MKQSKVNLLEKHVPLGIFGCFVLIVFGRLLEFSRIRSLWISKTGVAKSNSFGWQLFYRVSTGYKLISEMRQSRDSLVMKNQNFDEQNHSPVRTIQKAQVSFPFSGEEIFDYLIIGSGPGGLASARELIRSGLNVLIIEAGSGENIQGTQQSLEEVMDSRWEGFGKSYIKGDPNISILQGKGLGGSSAISGMIIHRLSDESLSALIEYFGEKKVFFDAEKYRRCEDDWIDALHVSSSKELYPGALKSGYLREMRTMPRAVLGCKDTGMCQLGCPNSGKNSLDQTLYRELQDLGCKFLFKHKAVVNFSKFDECLVNVTSIDDNFQYSLRPKYGVFLAAGAISSPKIVRSSGLIRKEVGCNLKLNFGPSAAFLYPRTKIEIEQFLMGIELFGEHEIKYASQSIPREMFRARLWPFSKEPRREFQEIDRWSIWTASFASDGKGSINPKTRTSNLGEFSLSDLDFERFRIARQTLEQIGCDFGAERIINLSSVGASHLFGTLSTCGPFIYSKNKIDENLKTLFRLTCVDASIIPLATGVNPILTILTVSSLITQQVLAEDLKN